MQEQVVFLGKGNPFIDYLYLNIITLGYVEIEIVHIGLHGALIKRGVKIKVVRLKTIYDALYTIL